MEGYANQGMLHGYVGNSCPSVVLSEKEGVIYICSYDEESDDNDFELNDTYKVISWVCTDLWWYSIVDLEVLKKLSNNSKEIEKQYEDSIVEIPAGTWGLEHYYGIVTHEQPYAKLTLIDEK